MAGTPEVLLSGLALPARLRDSGDAIWVANRPHYYLADAPGELLRLPKNDRNVSVAAEATSIEGFVLDGSRAWVASYNLQAVVVLDVSTGQTQRTITFDRGYPAAIEANADSVFVVVYNYQGTTGLWRLPKDGSTEQPLWQTSDLVEIHWLKATDSAVFLPKTDLTLNAVPTGQPMPYELLRVNHDGSSMVLASGTGLLGGIEVEGNNVVFLDYASGQVLGVPQAGGDVRVLAELDGPWAITTDPQFAYVATQPDICARPGGVYRVPLSGGPAVALATGLPCPSMLVTDEHALYWVNNGEDPTNASPGGVAQGSLMRLSRAP